MFPTAPETFLPTLRLLLITTMVATGCSGSGNSGTPATAQATGTPGAEQAVGERLFMETRFAQAFQEFLKTAGTSTIRMPAILSWILWKRWGPPLPPKRPSKACP
jgi:hypothetical protein